MTKPQLKILETAIIDFLMVLQHPTNDYWRTRQELRQQFGGIASRFVEYIAANDIPSKKDK